MTLPFTPIDRVVPPSSVSVYPSVSRFDPLVLVVTVRFPVVGGGGGAVQLTEKLVAATTPAMSETLRGLAPPTEQLEGTPDRKTV